MRAVSFNVTIPSFLIGKGLGGLTESAIFGGLSGVRFGEVSEPPLPADGWVRLEILKAGICGTDIGTLWSPSDRFRLYSDPRSWRASSRSRQACVLSSPASAWSSTR